MADFQWRYTIPSEGSLVGIGDEDIRHQKRQLEAALNESFNIGDDKNPTKPGAAQPIFQAASKNSYGPSGPATDHWYLGNQIFIESDTSRVYSFATVPIPSASNSNTTVLLGTPHLIEHGEVHDRGTWVERSDWTVVDSGDDSNAVYTIDYGINRGGIAGEPQGFDGIPTVMLTVQSVLTINNQPHHCQVITSERDKFSFRVHRVTQGTGSDFTVHWTSWGTIAEEI